MVAVDGHNLSMANLTSALMHIAQTGASAIFSISYEVSCPPTSRQSGNPLHISLQRTQGLDTPIGISLESSPKNNSSIIIDSIRQASIADR